MFNIIICLSICNIIFILLFIISRIKLHRLFKKYINDNRLFIINKNKISMIEYYYRNFKEGTNPYTVLRDISNTLKEEENSNEPKEDRA